MMQSMMERMMGGGMWIVGVIGILVLIVLVLVAAALVKYLFARNTSRKRDHE